MSFKKLTFITIIAAAVFWNSWLLGWLNHGSAGYLRMSISELNVIGQPNYVLFTALEFISGGLLAIAGLLMLALKSRGILFILIAITIALIGFLTIYDAATPLDCNQYQNKVCLQKDNDDQGSQVDNDHNIESRITAYVTILLSLLVTIWIYMLKSDKKLLWLAAVLFVIILVTLAILNYSSHIFANAILERIWNIAVSGDLILIAWLICSRADLKHKSKKQLAQ